MRGHKANRDHTSWTGFSLIHVETNLSDWIGPMEMRYRTTKDLGFVHKSLFTVGASVSQNLTHQLGREVCLVSFQILNHT